MRISDWSSDVCSSDLEKGTTERQNKEGSGCHARFVVRDLSHRHLGLLHSWAASYTLPALPTPLVSPRANRRPSRRSSPRTAGPCRRTCGGVWRRSEAHTSALQSLQRISYAVFCLKKNKQ